MIGVLIFGLVATAQQQTVTFTHACDKSTVVLKALGEEIGMDLRVGGTVHDDYFLVRFDDVPVQEALDKLATTLNATWKSERGINVLTRTSENVQAAHADLLKRYELIIAEERARRPVPEELTDDEVRAYFADPASLSGGSDYKNQAPARSPISRLAAQMLQVITPEMFADLPHGREVQFAIDPRPWQKRLPREAAKYIKDALDDQARYHQIAEGFPKDDWRIQSSIRQVLGDTREIDGFVFTAQRDEITARFGIHYLINGEMHPGNGFGFRSGWTTTESSFKWPETESQVEWTEEEKAIIDFAVESKDRFAKPYVRPPQAVIDYATSIDEKEFLAGIPSKPILQLLEEMDVNAVLALDDRVINRFYRLTETKLTRAAYIMLLGHLHHEDGWVWQDTFYTKNYRNTRINRKATADYLEVTLKEERKTLNAEADYLGAVESAPRSNIFITRILPNLFQANGPNSEGNLSGLKAYAKFGSAQQAEALSGGVTVSIRSLDKTTRQNLLEMVRSSRMPLANTRAGESPANVIGQSLPDDTLIRVEINRANFLFPGKAPGFDGVAGYGLMGAKGAAAWLARQEKNGGDSMSDFSNLLNATEAIVTMEIEIPGIGFYKTLGMVNETSFLAKPVPWQKLPEPIRSEFEKELIAARKKSA